MDNLTTNVSAWLRNLRRCHLSAKARLLGKAFACDALAGNSEINICINSDLTVSCNCHDVDGTGHIGDLNRQSLAECLSGSAADRFRRRLAQGRLPIPNCARCCDLRIVSKSEADRCVQEHQLPSFVMLENTSACNLRCTSCPRTTIRGLRAKPSMSLDDVQRVAGELKACRIERVAYLNLGEPFLSKNIRRELEIIRRENPEITINTSTNGIVIDSDEKRDAALLMDTMQVSIDGINQQMVTRYQRGSDFAKAYGNMKALVAHRDARAASRPTVIWKYLLFWWNDRKEYLAQAIEMAREARVDGILFEKTVSPFYAVPVRSYFGFHKNLGEDNGSGNRLVRLRPAPPREEIVRESLPDLAVRCQGTGVRYQVSGDRGQGTGGDCEALRHRHLTPDT